MLHVGKAAANVGTSESDTEATNHADDSQAKTSCAISEPVGEWCEATSPEGYVYYWNTVTKGG